jgi:hypothetical protein
MNVILHSGSVERAGTGQDSGRFFKNNLAVAAVGAGQEFV